MNRERLLMNISYCFPPKIYFYSGIVVKWACYSWKNLSSGPASGLDSLQLPVTPAPVYLAPFALLLGLLHTPGLLICNIYVTFICVCVLTGLLLLFTAEPFFFSINIYKIIIIECKDLVHINYLVIPSVTTAITWRGSCKILCLKLWKFVLLVKWQCVS